MIVKRNLALLLVGCLSLASLTGCGDNGERKDTTAVSGSAVSESAASGEAPAADETADADIEAPEGYHLVWHDEFDGDKLNEEDWNRETHPIGWVNNEWQEYVPSEDYAYV